MTTRSVVEFPLLDADGLYRIPNRLYLLLLLLLRPYLCWVLTLTLPAEQRQLLSLVYPHSSDFIRACLISLPVLLVVAALTQRVPFDAKLRRGRAKKFWFACWRQSRWLLLLVASVDLYWTVQHLPPYVTVHAPWLLLAPLALIPALWWLWRNPLLKHIFAEWPDDKTDSVKT
jgi:hypothetical protein